jgi:hypothetical protein
MFKEEIVKADAIEKYLYNKNITYFDKYAYSC